ncbi:MAG TPA: sensor histidine kinase [Bryobacteraceae bacterium]|nr:sensor histidine kinase [Bryobacteraceae bacterium]
MPVSKRASLGTGFGVITGLLVLSTALAYRIQESFSERSVAIHRHYVQEQEIVTNLRRLLYVAGVSVRDYLLNPEPQKREQYLERVEDLRRSVTPLLVELRSSSPHPAAVAELEKNIQGLWAALAQTVDLPSRGPTSYDFLQQEVVPRRTAAGQILQELESANRTALTSSEREFSETRSAAASNLLWLLACCLLVGVAVAWFSLQYSNHLEEQAAQRFDEVLDAKLELERLSKRLMDIQEEERTRLSRELHDEIVQNVAVLKIEITQALADLDNSRAREPLTRARELADRTVRAVRNISLLLRPSLLDDLGLGAALHWQTTDFQSRTGVPCEYIEEQVSDTLPGAISTCVYRVTQEALRNCEKHSKARHVVVRVSETADQLRVEVIDNGQGFKPGQRHVESLGVLGMRERAAALGGELQIDSAIGKGTTVRLTLPLKAETEKHTNSMEAHV